MPSSTRTPLTSLALVVLLAFSACKSSPEIKKDEGEPADLLDEPADAPSATGGPSSKHAPTASLEPNTLLLPDTPEKPSREIDGKADDWDSGKFRVFHTKSAIEEGDAFWDGENDASFRVGVDADEGFVYFLVEVKDDHVLDTKPGHDPSDAIVIYLRDPGLDSLAAALPGSVHLDQYVDAQTAIIIYPNARVASYDGQKIPFNDIMYHEVDRRKNGYVLEAAFKLEALSEVSAIPMPEIAFRVEVLDGDEPDRPGYQTRLSTLPSTDGTGPRMAVYNVGGLLPHAKLGKQPPRANAIGRWKYQKGKWDFVSFEVVPKYWVTLDDPSGFADAMAKSDALDDVCGVARKDIEFVETYQSRGGGFRSGLVLCGQRSSHGRCSSKARTNLFWVSLRPEDGGGWSLEKSINVFGKPLHQCTNEPAGDDPVYQYFSLYPLDVMGPTIWAVGWTRTRRAQGADEEASGVTFLNTKYEDPHIGQVIVEEHRAYPERRTLRNSSVYLTFVNDDDNVDLCQFETILDQRCTGLNRGCRTPQRGKSVLTHIQMWSPKRRKFERYELSKHRNCSTANFDFSKREGFLLLQLKGRVGLLPSPKSNEKQDDDHELDLF